MSLLEHIFNCTLLHVANIWDTACMKDDLQELELYWVMFLLCEKADNL